LVAVVPLLVIVNFAGVPVGAPFAPPLSVSGNMPSLETIAGGSGEVGSAV
jgi:hypothetical protein